jgi:hypothetical protein
MRHDPRPRGDPRPDGGPPGIAVRLAYGATFAVVLLLYLSMSSAEAASSPRTSRCRPPGSKTLVAGPTARVYSRPARPGSEPQSRPAVFGCLLATGRAWSLNATPKHPVSVFGQGVGFDFEPATVALGEGPWVAFAESFFSIDTSVQTVTTRDLRTGAVAHCAIGSTNAPGRPASVSRIVVGKDGTTVWVGRSGSNSPEPGTPEVGRCEGGVTGEVSILASGSGIEVGSLTTRGQYAIWSEQGSGHSASLVRGPGS